MRKQSNVDQKESTAEEHFVGDNVVCRCVMVRSVGAKMKASGLQGHLANQHSMNLKSARATQNN